MYRDVQCFQIALVNTTGEHCFLNVERMLKTGEVNMDFALPVRNARGELCYERVPAFGDDDYVQMPPGFKVMENCLAEVFAELQKIVDNTPATFEDFSRRNGIICISENGSQHVNVLPEFEIYTDIYPVDLACMYPFPEQPVIVVNAQGYMGETPGTIIRYNTTLRNGLHDIALDAFLIGHELTHFNDIDPGTGRVELFSNNLLARIVNYQDQLAHPYGVAVSARNIVTGRYNNDEITMGQECLAIITADYAHDPASFQSPLLKAYIENVFQHGLHLRNEGRMTEYQVLVEGMSNPDLLLGNGATQRLCTCRVNERDFANAIEQIPERVEQIARQRVREDVRGADVGVGAAATRA